LTSIIFAYPNAKYEAIGNPYINEKNLNNLVDSKNLTEFKDTLNSLKDYNVIGEDIYTIQKSLDDNFLQTIKMMQKDNSKKMKQFFLTYLGKKDVYLIKNELKKIVMGKQNETDIEIAILPRTKKILNKLKESDKENLIVVLKSYGFENDLIETIQKEPVDLLKIDIILDMYILNQFKKVKVPYNCEKAKQGFIKRILDIQNIKNVLRAKQLGYDLNSCKKLYLGEGQEIAPWKFNEISDLDKPSQIITALEGTSYFTVLKDSIELYNRENSVQVLENVLDGLFIKQIKDISLKNYLNLGPTLRFLVSKEFEITNLKIIAKGIGEKLSVDFIRNSLIQEAN
jgi:vacuolar-type H+-ATPase subunit C/Vma6